jgi:hypothetical protein
MTEILRFWVNFACNSVKKEERAKRVTFSFPTEVIVWITSASSSKHPDKRINAISAEYSHSKEKRKKMFVFKLSERTAGTEEL